MIFGSEEDRDYCGFQPFLAKLIDQFEDVEKDPEHAAFAKHLLEVAEAVTVFDCMPNCSPARL